MDNEVGILLCCYCRGKSHEEAMHDDEPATYVYFYKDEIVKYFGRGNENIKNHLIEFPPLGEVVDTYEKLTRLNMLIDMMVKKYIDKHIRHLDVPDDSGIASHNNSYQKFFRKVTLRYERDHKLNELLDENK